MDPREAAIDYLDEKAFGRAQQLLQEWVLAHPDDAHAHKELIWCFYKRSMDVLRWRGGDHFYEQVYNKPNAQAIRRFVQAEQLYYEDRDEGSLVHYRAAIDQGLDVPALHHSLASALGSAGRSEEAKTEYRIALRQDPRFLPTLDAYGHMLFEEGRFDQIEGILEPLEKSGSESLKHEFRDASKVLAGLRHLKEACATLHRSVALRYEGKMRDAVLTLWPALLQHADNCWFVRTIVYLFYRADWLHFCRTRLEEILDEESPMLSYARGLTFWYEDKNEEALRSYDAAVDKGMNHPLVRYARALVYETFEKSREQETDLLAAFSCAPWLIDARADLARLKYKQATMGEVEQLADVTSEEYNCAASYDVSGRGSLAKLERLALSSLLRQGRADEALQRIRLGVLPCQDEDLRFRRAMILAENREYGEAASELAESLRLDYQAIGTGDEGDKERLELTMQSQPGCFYAALGYALLPAFADDLAQARQNLEKVVRRFPREPQAWYHIANVSSILGDGDRAKKACRKALALDDGCRDALLLLCQLLQDDGDIRALRALSKKLSGAAEPLESALGWAEENKQPQIAREIAAELLGVDPANGAAVHCLLEGLGPDSIEAFRLLGRLAARAPLHFETGALVARGLLLGGEAEAAAECYDGLFANGYDSLPDVVMHGLAFLAAEQAKEH